MYHLCAQLAKLQASERVGNNTEHNEGLFALYKNLWVCIGCACFDVNSLEVAGEAREHTTRDADAGYQESSHVKFLHQLCAWIDAERKLGQKQLVKSSHGSRALLYRFGKHIQVISRIQLCGLLMCAKVFIYGTWFKKNCAQVGSSAFQHFSLSLTFSVYWPLLVWGI